MCLEVSIELEGASRETASDLARAAKEEGQLHLRLNGSRLALRKGPTVLSLSEDGGCGCSLLADDADWDEDRWSMRPEVLPRMATTVVSLGEASGGGLTFRALWGGDSVKETLEVELGELAEIIRSGTIGTKVAYRVGPRIAT